MSRFSGILQISQNQSSVDGNILLMSGVADPNQAMSSATSFVQGKGFRSGYKIVVIGELGQVGSISGIILTDAVAPSVAAPAPAAMAAVASSAGVTSLSPAARKKSMPKKKKPAAPKKKAASKKAKKRTTKSSLKRKAATKKSSRRK